MIKSVIWASMLDYPKKVCTTIFFDKCNLKCEYCHNKNLKKQREIDFNKEILPKLLQRKSMIKHVILSGGECTEEDKLPEIIYILHKNGFNIGLHTNRNKL